MHKDDWIQIAISRGACETLQCALEIAIDEDRSVENCEEYEVLQKHFAAILERPYIDEVASVGHRSDN